MSIAFKFEINNGDEACHMFKGDRGYNTLIDIYIYFHINFF